jgi:hypothetical protein
LRSLSYAAALGFALAPAASIAATPSEKPACIQAGDDCVKNGADVAACRAAQASCLAMGDVVNPPGSAIPPAASGRDPPTAIPESPPLQPSDESPGDPLDPAMQACESMARNILVERLKGEIRHVLVTRNSRFGMVWRADVATPADGGTYAQRAVCIQGGFFLAPMKGVGGEVPPLP